jgi:hypothetical protein
MSGSLSTRLFMASVAILVGALSAGAAPAAGVSNALVAGAPVAMAQSVAPAVALWPAQERNGFRTSLPADSIAPETCQLLTPYGDGGSAGKARTWGAFPPAMSHLYRFEDGSSVGLAWGIGSPVPYAGVKAYRCCTTDSCHVCDASGCRPTRGGSGEGERPAR